MPFNRDFIESGCVLKTFDGDLTLLERAVDYTVNKSSSISPPKDETAVVAPVLLGTEGMPKERRHIKDVVYGDKSDEMPSTAAQEINTEPQQAVKVPDVSNHVSKQMVDVPAVSGFCFRHNIEESRTINTAVQTVCNTVPEKVVKVPDVSNHVAKQMVEVPAVSGFGFRHNIQETKTISNAVRPTNASRDLCRATRVSRSVKDVVYGDFDLDGQVGQSTQIKTESKLEQPQTPVTHFKSCMREELPVDSIPHQRIAVKALMSETSHHTHWRSAIHGF
jgi:hypothetical protein